MVEKLIWEVLKVLRGEGEMTRSSSLEVHSWGYLVSGFFAYCCLYTKKWLMLLKPWCSSKDLGSSSCRMNPLKHCVKINPSILHCLIQAFGHCDKLVSNKHTKKKRENTKLPSTNICCEPEKNSNDSIIFHGNNSEQWNFVVL